MTRRSVGERLFRWAVGDREAAEGILGDLHEEWERGRRSGRDQPGRRSAVLAWLSLRYLAERMVPRRRGRRGFRRGMHGRRRTGLVSPLFQDLQYAFRVLRKRPGFALIAVTTLGLGIGANTTIFSVFNWVLLRPVPGVTAQEELVTLRFGSPEGWTVPISYPAYRQLADMVTTLDGVMAHQPADMHFALDHTNPPRRLQGEVVSGDYFAVLGVRPVEGRGFSVEEETIPHTYPVAIISHRLWSMDFARDPGIIGRPFRLNGHDFTVVGVAPPGFHGVEIPGATDLWVPVMMHRQVIPNYRAGMLSDHGSRLFFAMVGRRAPDVGYAAVATEVGTLVEGLEVRAPDIARGFNGIDVLSEPRIGRRGFSVNRLRETYRLLGVVVGIVLLIACANAANLLLARASGRRRETAIRQAIGAGRGRLIRQHLTEAWVLAAFGGVVGILLSVVAVDALGDTQLMSFLPAELGIRVDARVLTFTVVLSGMTGLLFGLAPALAASRVDVMGGLKSAMTGVGGMLGRRLLVTVQIAASLVLLVAAGLFTRTVANLVRIDPGFAVDEVIAVSVDPSVQGYDDDRRVEFFSQLHERIGALPVATATALANLPPFSHMRMGAGVWLDEETVDDARTFRLNAVTPSYFRTLGVSIVSGRDFTDGEFRADSTAPKVMILNQLAAETLWPGESAVGRTVYRGYREAVPYRVVGVVEDFRFGRITEEVEPMGFDPFRQEWVPARATLHVRSTAGLGPTVAGIRGVISQLDPNLPIYDVATVRDLSRTDFSEQTMLARLIGGFAILALLLAALGLYGVVNYAIAARSQEFGLRMALGARRIDVLSQVIRESLRLVGLGAIVGLVVSLGAVRFVESRLFAVAPFDPRVFTVAVVVLMGTALMATWVPARRATTVDPTVALRREG